MTHEFDDVDFARLEKDVRGNANNIDRLTTIVEKHAEDDKIAHQGIRDQIQELTNIQTAHAPFVNELIQEQHRKKINREKVLTQVKGWGIITLLGAMGTYVAAHFNHIMDFFSSK